MPAPAAEPCTLDSTIFGIRRRVVDEGVIVLAAIRRPRARWCRRRRRRRWSADRRRRRRRGLRPRSPAPGYRRDASTSAPSCSSFFAIERSIELKAAGRLSVMVAIGPSIRSSAGSSGREVAWAGVGMGKASELGEKVGRHLNSRRQEVTIPGKSAKCATSSSGDALAPLSHEVKQARIVRDAATSAAHGGRGEQAEIAERGDDMGIPVRSQSGLSR